MADLVPIGYRGRVEALRERASAHGADGVLLTSPVNVRWASGFTGSSGALVVTPDQGPLQGFELLEQWLAWRETCLVQPAPAQH